MKKMIRQQLCADIDALLHTHADIEEFDLLSVDFCGHFFGKRYPIDKLRFFAEHGLALPRSMFVLSTLGEPLEKIHFGREDGDPDAHFHIIPGSLAINRWGSRPRLQVMATTMTARQSIFFEPRAVLSRVLAAYEAKKWSPMVAFELEFYLFEQARDNQQLIQTVRNPKTGRVDTATVLSTTRIGDFEQLLDEIISACKQQNIETGALSSEMGPGQFEINFNHHRDVLRAADETCLFKRTVVEVAKKHGMIASFIAKPMLDQPGSGLHMHVSVVDKMGKNLFSAGDKPHPRLLQAIGGLLDCLPASMSFWAPNLNSFRRYTGDTNCVPVGLSWGQENRTVAFRIPLAEDGAWRVENRVPGADANPYLAMAAMLSGILWGIEQRIEPGQVCGQSVAESDAALPLNQASALHTTLGSEALIKFLGADFTTLYCQHRESESRAFNNHISAREYDWYL